MTGGGLIVAAPKSGSGKTLVVAGLLRHLRDRGVRVAAAKCGPDYIDPTFHALASGGLCTNLDPWAMRPDTLAGLASELEAAAEIVICEGVMGLFDGAGASGDRGSTAELARLTGWPVVLVVDASGQGASVAALVAGFAHHDRAVPIAGVILNRVAGDRHRALLTQAMARHVPDVPVLGAVPGSDALGVPGRHLGLVPATELMCAEQAVAHAARVMAENIDTARLLGLPRAPSATARPVHAPIPPLGRHIAVARDDAFLFTYEAVLAGWRRRGSAISCFSPLADQPPSSEADAVYLPGGYPELHAGRLASAARFLGGLRMAASEGKPIYGECGGYMVLGEALVDALGECHPMAGLLPLTTCFADRRRHLGYRRATLLAAGPLGAAGASFRGHEFHYATVVAAGAAEPLFAVADAAGDDLGPAGLRRGGVAGSFIHLIDRED
ncbi:MAG TPA: cobyrinate a,c-diamide synthase [Stellaceae bacterium]|nr:cobyrinate a,c-diamide synthase [Stellaceae bacterium]